MRHAQHDRGKLTESGRRDVGDVAERLAGWLDEHDMKVLVKYAKPPEVKATARMLFEETAHEVFEPQAAANVVQRARQIGRVLSIHLTPLDDVSTGMPDPA